ncbi:MAG: SCO family protein [Acidimicrobiales bacterium]
MIVAALAFAVVQPIKVLPRVRLAPGFALTDSQGATVTSEDARGAVTLYTFAPSTCTTDCEAINATMAEVQRRVAAEVDLEGIPFQLITIAIDSPTSGELAAAQQRSGADGTRWQWLTADQITLKSVVGSGFGRFFSLASTSGAPSFDPGFVLVDGWGVVRGDYRYQTIATDADKIVSHVGILADEVRYGHGAASVAYEAAHLFLCYP